MGSLTDVPGVRVGHDQKVGDGWLTGVTVVLPPPGTVGSVDVQGGGPATHETDALDPTSLVSQVDAVVLAGGSAYGLAAAAGTQRWCEENGRGFEVPGGVVPIVPAAAIFDLGRGGNFAARATPDMGYAATSAAAAEKEGHDVGRGNVGAGTGALLGRTYKGGVGTASVTLDGGVIVGALAVVNALGLPLVEHSLLKESVTGPPLNTTLVVVATNAVLDVAECKRTASASHAGIARALSPSHTLADGDTVFCLATGTVALDRSDETARQVSLITLQSAAADVVRLAILDGVASAEAVSTPAGDFGAYGGQIR
ncbi:P1 family peptidase [Pseudarthrobacter sp. NamE2]|uniref:P1 family peptidase n=1 Tax=Pseudarthrobacter sp. NamE2 TaxID=2576838 RepID=UPI0010FD4FAF|nr:P1 family peptidase [Pseudarthrobacter sp. NamE2]TLM85450.1 P1 family peptidase [Pseudarthrobacter sp. NamE2]